jgi:hypothetical protein
MTMARSLKDKLATLDPTVNGGDKSGHAAAQNPASGGVPSGMARALPRWLARAMPLGPQGQFCNG